MKDSIKYILLFSFIAPLIFFVTLFAYQMGDEYVLTTLDNVTQNLTPQLGVSVPMQNHIAELPVDYRNLPIPFDIGFLLSFLVVFIGTIVMASKEPESSWFSFFGTVTFGFMVFLFFTGWIISLTDWFVLNLIENFLGFDIGSTPMFYYWITTLGTIIFIWYIIVVLVNKLNFTFKRESDNKNINIPGGNV